MLVIGGGITGAGVALDAATRGYSVALVERGDYAIGTSSRSSKLVHGGLRYLQNFDLGLVREALLERQINVALAPHLVRPLPLIVPAFDGARPDRLTGLGLNMYDVMAVDRLSPLARRRDRNRDGVEDWSPARHRVISGEEVAELLPALAGRTPERRLPLLRLPDRRRPAGADRARRGRALRRGRRQRRRGARAARGGRPRGRRAGARRGERRGARGPRRQRRQRHRRVGRPAAPRRAARRGRGAGHPAQPRDPHHRPGRHAAAAWRARSRRRAAGGRSSCCRGSARR